MVNSNILHYRNALQTYILLMFLYTFSTLIHFQSYLPELPTRLDMNESFVNSYFLLWTNFWYLAPFYFLLFLLLPWSKFYFFVITTSYVIYTTELNDFITLNLTWRASELTQFNTLLTNSLNKYHPFIFFLSTLFLFYYVLTTTFIQNKTHYQSASHVLHIKRNNYKLLQVNTIALMLGGVWAFQEASWGGFWNWDSSETFGLLFLLTSVYLTHVRLTVVRIYELTVSLTMYLKFIVILYCFIQLNFDLVSHNFGAKFFYFFSNSLFYEEVILVNILSLIYFITYWWKSNINLKILTTSTTRFYSYHNTTYLYTVVIWFALSLVLLYSCSQLISYFMFNLFHLNILNLVFSLDYYITTLLLLLSFFFAPWLRLNPILVGYLCSSILNLIFMFSFTLVWGLEYFGLIHNCLILTLVVNLLTYYMNFITWFFKPSAFFFLVDGVLLVQEHFIITCDALFVNVSSSITSTTTLINWWNLFFQYNTVSTNAFFLLITNTGCFSLYQLTLSWVNSLIYISTPYVNLLFVLIITTLALFNLSYNQALRAM